MNHLKSLEIAWNHSNIIFKYNIFVSKNFSKNFRDYIRMENSNYENENIDTKYLKTMCEKIFV